MSTEFSWRGNLVALRFHGGSAVGVRVELLEGAVQVDGLDVPLAGEDGSLRSLRELAAEVGNGRSGASGSD